MTLDDHNVVQPDIFFNSKARAVSLQDDRILGAPDLCVEIHSPGTEHLDRVRSVAGYEEPFRPAAFPGFEFTLSVVALPDGR